MSWRKIVKESIGEQIYAVLKEDILHARHKPGEKLNPRKLAQEVKTSIMPVRDALNQLVDEGLVVRKPRVGFFVRSFTPLEIAELMEVRKLYELYCLEEYFDKIDREKIAKYLEKTLKRKNVTSKDREFDEIDEGIHGLIIKASGNNYLINTYNSIRNYFFILKHLDLAHVQVAQEEHISLMQAILNKEKEKAKDILKKHI
ncbi:GntR family transcriptional regulator, partial [Candidatus Aerophobetes bacterium]|nr:GntR family transcriptional regulator [Candidatus Aerophobetes bacterium]